MTICLQSGLRAARVIARSQDGLRGVLPMTVQRVFLLGAGASKSWGLPLTNQLFPLALTGVPKRVHPEAPWIA